MNNKIEITENTPIRVRIACNQPGHTRPCDNRVMEAGLVDSHLQVQAFIHGKISGMSSGVTVKYTLKLAS